MRHILFEQSDSYPIALLIKPSAFSNWSLDQFYVTPLTAGGIPRGDIIALDLEYDQVNKVSAKTIKSCIKELLPAMREIGVKTILVADNHYYKALTKQAKTETNVGYVHPCAIPGYEDMSVILSTNYQQLVYNPQLKEKLDRSIDTVIEYTNGTFVQPGSMIIHSAHYPKSNNEIASALAKLHNYPVLYADIEAFSLDFRKAGIGTIAFAWDKHNGMAFNIDYIESHNFNSFTGATSPIQGYHKENVSRRNLLKHFLSTYKGKIVWHNACYDVKVLIFNLYMSSLLDTRGLLDGLEILTTNFDDTKIISYLATNSTSGNHLSLKEQAQEFAGNWAQEDITDIRKIPLPELLQYNLVDALSTAFVHEKNTPIMIADNQEAIYKDIMLPSVKTILQMELTGMPINWNSLIELEKFLVDKIESTAKAINDHHIIKTLNFLLQEEAMDTANAKLKTKQHSIDKYEHLAFNPNSNKQLQTLLYTQMALPVLDTTPTGAPATGAETIAKLVAHTTNPDYVTILNLIIEYSKAAKIQSTFIPAFKTSQIMKANDALLFGSFNIGGTVSGRLSSSQPNLQNLPSGSEYGKAVKQIFSAPQGWIFCGADFNSLEDYISALTTKDPNKLAVYEQGFDGHCLRAAYYFKDHLLHIDVTDPVSVNSIKHTHPKLRQDSKAPTFALTYQGTWVTLVKNLGLPEKEAKEIEANYHELYKVSDQYVQDKLMQASKDGYVEVAFGLRVRTPLLKQVMYGSKVVPYEAAAEGRTAGNALGQSYGLLNNRAANEFMQRVHASKYRLDVKPVALIHDAIYLVIKDDIEVVHWVNENLIECMQWQELPEIQHPTVKLGAALDLYYPNWAHPITLPNNASPELIKQLCEDSSKPKK